MKNIYKTVWLKCIIMILGIFFCITLLFLEQKDPTPLSAPSKPFRVSVSSVKLVHRVAEEPSPLPHKTENRLVLTVSIENQTPMDYKDVQFKILLNQEVEPYIASKIIEFTGDPMHVTTVTKAQANFGGKELLVSGFLHEWSMLLTTESDLKTYYGLAPEGIAQALQSITALIEWDGGYQQEIIPLSLEFNAQE